MPTSMIVLKLEIKLTTLSLYSTTVGFIDFCDIPKPRLNFMKMALESLGFKL